MILDGNGNELNKTATDVLLVSVLKGKASVLGSLKGDNGLTGGLAVGILANLDGVFNHSKAVEELVDFVVGH